MILPIRKNLQIVIVLSTIVTLVVTGFAPLENIAMAAVSPGHVQSKDGYTSSGRTIKSTFTSPAASGNLIVAYAVWSNTGTASLSDNLGNTYASAGAAKTWGSNYSAQVFYAKNIAGGSTTVTATLAKSVSFGILYIHEYSGLDKINPFDGGKSAKGSSTELNSGVVMTTNNNDLLFGAGASVGAVTSGGTGFTVRSMAEGNITEDRYVTTAGSYSSTATHGGGNWVMQVAAFKANAAVDVVAPSVPVDLTAAGSSTSQINLNWTASTDNVGVAGYKVYRDGNQVGTANGASFQDNGLSEGTTYTYTVSAFDVAGNNSAQSADVSATTYTTGPDTEAPTTPTNLRAVTDSGSQATLFWSASNDNVGVTGYRIARDGAPLTEVTSPGFTDTGLIPETAYTYTVAAIDAAGNMSAMTAPVTVVTPPQSPGFCGTIPSTSTTKPTANNTGVPPGTILSTTPPAGVEVTSDSWKVTVDGTVIDGKDIEGKTIDIRANNVTIRNSKIVVPVETYWAIDNQNTSYSGLTILNSEITSDGGANTGIVAARGTTVCGTNVHGFENLASIEGNDVIFQSNYLHINQASPSSNDPHNDVIEVRMGTNIKLLGNNLTQTNPDETWQHNTGVIYAAATYGDIDRLVIDGNWLGGGTYSLYLTTVNLGTNPVLRTVDVTNNKWYRNSYAYGTHSYDPPWTPRTWSNNTFEDNGELINL